MSACAGLGTKILMTKQLVNDLLAFAGMVAFIIVLGVICTVV